VLISIIIPSFNSIALLPHALESILTQSFNDFEVVIMDNCSTDGTIKLIENYSAVDKRIQFYSEKDYGIYDAMNKGIKNAKGEWLFFMGSDDSFYDQDVLKEILPMLNLENEVLYGDVRWIPENKLEAGELVCEDLINMNINHQRIFYRKSVFEKYGNLNTKYEIAADHEMNIRFFCNSNIHKIYIPLTICNFHSGGFSANKTDEVFWQDWDWTILKNFKPYLPKKNIYGSLGIYIRYLVGKKKYTKVMALLCKHFFHTRSLGFVKLMLVYMLTSKTNHAG
jgi:glycosyltransferase involved in cell wall biosynthesis